MKNDIETFLLIVTGFLLFISVWLLVVDISMGTNNFVIYLTLMGISLVLILIISYFRKKRLSKAVGRVRKPVRAPRITIKETIEAAKKKKKPKPKKGKPRKTSLMKQFEKETGKHAIWQGKVTKNYKEWKKKR